MPYESRVDVSDSALWPQAHLLLTLFSRNYYSNKRYSMKLPRVVIVGRTNVGKSTLFNRLSVNAKSMTFDYEGVTRDFIKDIVTWRDHTFELIDTGGISLRKSQDEIQEQVRQQAIAMMEKADLLLFVCDGTVGLTTEDQRNCSNNSQS